MSSTEPVATRLADYAPPAFLIDEVDLDFELGEGRTLVRARLAVRRNPAAEAVVDLVLDGRGLDTRAVRVDGESVSGNRVEMADETLTVRDVPDAFVLETEVAIRPGANKSLEGLYASSGNLCTQCEAEGFRKITWFLDRPDVMARYRTRIVADPRRYPVMLSNGNDVERGDLDDGRRYVVWEDPYPKPSYLFALVAGRLECVEDVFTTRSGRPVTLRIYVQPHNIDRCGHAMRSLQRAMRWDEEVYGLEYDLDTFMVVAVDDFNMGAMENKGLNVFNSAYVLARPDTATDRDFAAIETVIAHEYFHNWTGNRVTCRDWFQLSLKEGLTVFRDQEFSADVASRAVKRIRDVRLLRTHQFAEDAGPMAHPVRPDSYIEISNFYTVTIYNKAPRSSGCCTPCSATRHSRRACGSTSSATTAERSQPATSWRRWRPRREWTSNSFVAGTPRRELRCSASGALTMRRGRSTSSISSRAHQRLRGSRRSCRCTFRSGSRCSTKAGTTSRSMTLRRALPATERRCSTCARRVGPTGSRTFPRAPSRHSPAASRPR